MPECLSHGAFERGEEGAEAGDREHWVRDRGRAGGRGRGQEVEGIAC